MTLKHLLDRPSEIRHRDMILRELFQASVLSHHTGGSYTAFPHVKALLHSNEEEILIDWMIQHIFEAMITQIISLSHLE